jgi:drug/metabolite transporter (DMT)-like permease
VAETAWLWAVFTVIAAFAQTVRNAMQRELTASLGTVGATHVRFLFGFPFVLVSLAGVLAVTGGALPRPAWSFWPWVIDGALAQIAATALMLAAMNDRSFVVTIAYIKTEPVQVALFGFVLLGDRVTLPMAIAILIATAGVVVMSLRPGAGAKGDAKEGSGALAAGTGVFGAGTGVFGAGTGLFGAGSRATVLGLVSGAMFGLSATGYRGAILSLTGHDYVTAATFTLAVGLVMQATILSLYLWWRDRAVLTAIMRAWRPSLFAGFMGAFASQFWFLAFALATAASVRTLALVEVLFAQAISRFVLGQATSAREGVGIVLIVLGVALLIWAY